MKSLLYKRYVFIAVLVVFCSVNLFDNLHVKTKGYDYTSSLCINEIMISNRNSVKDRDGDYENWIEIYNKSEASINLKGFALTDDKTNPYKWVFSDLTIEGKAYLLVWASGKNRCKTSHDLHTNFKLESTDKVIVLSSPDGKWSNIVKIEKISDNISYGRSSDGAPTFSTFDNGTPGSSNNGQVSLKDGIKAVKLDEPKFSAEGGIYSEAFDLILSKNKEEINIYYTLDGSIPTEKSLLYTNPIKILPKDKGATIIRAVACKSGYKSSNIVTQSYFVNNSFIKGNLPIVSLVSDPANLFDYHKGILVPGEIYDNWVKSQKQEASNTKKIEANYTQSGSKWERESNFELFEAGKTTANQGIGIRVFGGYSRDNNIKSLALFARNSYDDKTAFNITFDDKDSKKTDTVLSKLILRTPSSDHLGSFFRDELIQGLIPKSLKLDTQQNKTCLVFVNGEYYGIQNIKEAYSSDYFYNHYKVGPEDIVVLENPTGVAGIQVNEGFAGDEMHFDRMHAFIESNSMKNNSNYNYVKSMMDIDNFIEYNILQLYCVNRDWPGNNVKIWRKRTEKYNPSAPYGNDGRWRWLVYDTDDGFGLFSKSKDYNIDMISFATEANGPIWPNPPWSTVILRSLLDNSEFKTQFINTFADRLNTIYTGETVLKQIEYYEHLYNPYVLDHIRRWNEIRVDISIWQKEIDSIKEFALKRPDYARQHIINYFHLSGSAEVNLDISNGGKVKLNTLAIDGSSSPWKGTYFKDLSINLEAIPEEGYVFEGWTGSIESKAKSINIELKDSINLKALFSKAK